MRPSLRDIRGPADLEAWLRSHAVPCDFWGVEGAKSVGNLWHEIVSGEATLSDDPPLRRVSVVSVRIREDGRQLTEVGQLLADGTVRTRNAPPSEKMQPGEAPVAAAVRCLAEELGVPAADAHVDPESLSVSVETVVSPSYPGLESEYRLHTVDARVPGLPRTAFTTREAPGTDTAVTSHYWEWR